MIRPGNRKSDAPRSRFDDDAARMGPPSEASGIVSPAAHGGPHPGVPELPLARNELPKTVQKLIEQQFHSVADVDTLLLLVRDHRGWDASAVARKLRIDVDQTAEILARLRRRGLLRAEEDTYRFDPRDPALAAAVMLLANLYPTYRVAIVSKIYARPSGPITDFSDAFRLRKET